MFHVQCASLDLGHLHSKENIDRDLEVLGNICANVETG